MNDMFADSGKNELHSAERIQFGLKTRFVGKNIHHWPAIGSTNEELKRLADEGAPEGTLAITDEQLAGRGRLDRTWIAPAGSSLLMSLLFRPEFLAPTRVQQLTMVCSLAVADAVAEVTALRPTLKWPNDVQIKGRKLAGVLTELGFAPISAVSGESEPGPELAWVIVGVGLNVNVNFAEASLRRNWPDLADTATSLAMVLGQPVSRLKLLHSYLLAVETRYNALRSGVSPHREWAARLVTLGQHVKVTAPDGVYQGVAEAVDDAGALLLRQSDGQLQRVLAGDVTLR
jgi:BirA family biotin operon repressor/biotin-[acetyl-CoA-carboxylase] ligase